MTEYKWTVLLQCDGCRTPLILQDPNSGSINSCAAITMLGRHFCAECSEIVLGINIFPPFLMLAEGLSDQKAVGWN